MGERIKAHQAIRPVRASIPDCAEAYTGYKARVGRADVAQPCPPLASAMVDKPSACPPYESVDLADEHRICRARSPDKRQRNPGLFSRLQRICGLSGLQHLLAVRRVGWIGARS